MSESRPPLPLILAGAVGVLVLALFGLNALRGDGTETATLGTKPAPAVVKPSAAVVVGDAAPQVDSDAAHRDLLAVARKLLAQGEEATALDLVEAELRDAGPEPTLLRFREALMTACEAVLKQEREKIGREILAGRLDDARAHLAILLRRLPGTYQSELSDLRTELYTPGADAAAARAELDRRLTTLTASPTPEGYYELALWARNRGFAAESHGFLVQTVALDGFHEGARKALGHRKHEGRWYSDVEFKRDVLGLIKSADGRWVKKPTPKPKVKVVAKKKKIVVPPPPPSPYQEDTTWYKDPDSKDCEWEDAKDYKTRYYIIRTNVKPAYAKKYGRMMDKYFKRFRSVFKNFLPPTGYERSEIYIHASKKEFHKENPKVPKTAGGFYQPKTKRVVAFHGMFTKQMTTRDVLAHEGTHQFEDIVLQGKFWNCPIWIIEGLAVFFESAYFNGSEVRIGLVPRERLWTLKRGIANSSLIPLRKLLRTPQRQFGGYHYAHAWSLIYMVIYGDKSKKARAKKQKWFGELFIAALKGKVSAEQVELKIGGAKAFDELEAAWKEYIKELPYDYKPPR
ncbi:MAG: DUF1570 domain-containing protein [Planctomycetes bacterium]|nr:DUF1570 domain-containing protein [Planctomycetota bacterium]